MVPTANRAVTGKMPTLPAGSNSGSTDYMNMQKQINHLKGRGFTLVEIMVVMVIIALIMGLVATSMSSSVSGAEARAASGDPRAALEDLHLAELRAESAEERRRVVRARDEVLAVREAALARGRAFLAEGSKGAARDVFEDILDRFGSRWCGDAARALEQMGDS